MAERRALFEQQQKSATAVPDSIHRAKSGGEPEKEQNQNRDAAQAAPSEKNLTLKERMAKFGAPTDGVQTPRPPPKVSGQTSSSSAPKQPPLSPTIAHAPESELHQKV